jgi:hypothetical protein
MKKMLFTKRTFILKKLILQVFCLLGSIVYAQSIPKMPMQMPYENTMEYSWTQKEVQESMKVSDMETMGNWKHANYGSLSLSQERSYDGQSSLLITSPTKGNEPTTTGAGLDPGRPWGTASAIYEVDGQDWSEWNRISFWIYPDLPGFKIVSINMVFHNEGNEKVPGPYDRNGLNFQVLENQKWNQVHWEIAHLGRDKVTGVEIRYRLQGHEPGTSATVKYYIDEMYLEKVKPDNFEGWEVGQDQIAYNHLGYPSGFEKVALASNLSSETFTLVDINSNKTILEKPIESKNTPLGTFQILDFSEVNSKGKYAIKAGDYQTKPFQINSFDKVYRSTTIKTINHFYAQRCGFAVEGVHEVCHRDWMGAHGDKMLQINGGWHDAGDLSQGLVNTAEATYAMLMLAGDLQQSDPELSDRLLEEAEWGLDWMLKTRFGDGYRSYWSTYDFWTDGILGTVDDVFSEARNNVHGNFIAATTEATAAILFATRNPYLSQYALQSAIEDWGFASENSSIMNIELAGAGLNASLALYDATSDDKYKTAAFLYADYIMNCQQLDSLQEEVQLRGFFYKTPQKEEILHYYHRGHEQDAAVGLVKLAQLFPESSSDWEKALQLYAQYYKDITTYTAPYHMLPAGIYDLTKAKSGPDKNQVKNGIKLNDRYYLKRFPVWDSFRGNSGTILSQAKGLAKIAGHLNDQELFEIVSSQLNWHLGLNPFNQSLMYGEGHRYAGQYTVMSGNIVGGLPVGVQTHFDRDVPYWPAENVYNWKEIWVHPSTRWLMLMSEFIKSKQ